MNQPNKPKIIDRVRKLMNLANDDAAGGGHERENAMRMALKLIAKHNLQPGDYEDRPDRQVNLLRVDVCPWRRSVCSAVGAMFFCEVLQTRYSPQSYDISFVGKESNSITAREMAHYLIRSFTKEAKARRRKIYGDAKGEASRWETSFLNGAASALWVRCKQFRDEAEAELATEQAAAPTPITGTALTLSSVYESEKQANEDFIRQVMNIDLKPNPKNFQVNRMAFDEHATRAGRAYGESVQLNKQLA